MLPTAIATTQVRQIYSETFRADSNRITAYQVMAAIMAAGSLVARGLLEDYRGLRGSLSDGLAVL